KNVDLIVFRGVMTSILCMPYMRQDEWHLSATKVGNTIVIENRPTAAKLRDNDPSKQTFRQRLATYWGHRFETISTMPVPAYEINSPGIDGNCITNTNAEYCSVFHTQLGSHGIVMAAEVDCATSRKVTDPADSTSRHPNRLYLELKTSKQPGNPTEVQFFERNKLLKFWAQSFLAGIPTVIVGWRTHSGRGSNRCSVTGIQRFETRDIPRMVRGKPWMWDPNVCLNFADEFIAFMKQFIFSRWRYSVTPST
ncbi:RAI1-domain-containing protein, partial [Ramicandelaber brevisporus]